MLATKVSIVSLISHEKVEYIRREWTLLGGRMTSDGMDDADSSLRGRTSTVAIFAMKL